jgi:hypothetical protein
MECFSCHQGGANREQLRKKAITRCFGINRYFRRPDSGHNLPTVLGSIIVPNPEIAQLAVTVQEELGLGFYAFHVEVRAIDAMNLGSRLEYGCFRCHAETRTCAEEPAFARNSFAAVGIGQRLERRLPGGTSSSHWI